MLVMDDEIQALLRRQRGLATRSQLLSAGVSKEALRWRIGRAWRIPLPGVVATFTGVLDANQRLIAAQLFAGPAAFISSWTAAALLGLATVGTSHVIRLVVPERQAARRSAYVVVSRTTRPDTALLARGPLRIASRPRAVVDAARELTGERKVNALIIEAVQSRVVTVEALRTELESGQRRGSATVRRAIDLAERGAWSVAEVDLLELLAQSQILPEAWANPHLTSLDGRRLPTPDAWLDDVGLAVQVHSRAYHLRDDDWESTVSGDSALGEHGVVVLGVTPHQISSEPDAVRQRVERAYLNQRDRDRPAVLAVPRISAARPKSA
jgi:hypothetical protein